MLAHLKIRDCRLGTFTWKEVTPTILEYKPNLLTLFISRIFPGKVLEDIVQHCTSWNISGLATQLQHFGGKFRHKNYNSSPNKEVT